MSYEPDAHAVQMKILRYLLLSPHATFAVLRKDADMQSDQFTFHLKKLLSVGYVAKEGRLYRLTRVGKEYANRMDTDDNVIEKQPKLSVVLIVENDKGEMLQQERLKHPYFGFWGFATGKVRWGETLIEAGARELLEETGLTADLRVVGFYHKMDYDEESRELLEDKYFCILHGTNPKGELIVDAEGHHNEWMTNQEFTKKEKQFGNVVETRELVRSAEQVILERQYYYAPDEY
ncbi:MAG: putative hydrolase [Marmoricola sp.]|nr:putative hydrolase [Marmoricola sp.]